MLHFLPILNMRRFSEKLTQRHKDYNLIFWLFVPLRLCARIEKGRVVIHPAFLDRLFFRKDLCPVSTRSLFVARQPEIRIAAE